MAKLLASCVGRRAAGRRAWRLNLLSAGPSSLVHRDQRKRLVPWLPQPRMAATGREVNPFWSALQSGVAEVARLPRLGLLQFGLSEVWRLPLPPTALCPGRMRDFGRP